MSEEARQDERDRQSDGAGADARAELHDTAPGSASTARRRAAPWFFGGLVLLLLATLVALQVSGVWEFVTPDTASDALLLYALSTLNFVAFVIFSFVLLRSLLKLRSERKARTLGSKIKTRLIAYFIAVSLLPITGMAVFSYLFFNRTLEKTFGRFPGDVIQEAQHAREEDAAQQVRALQENLRVAASAVSRHPDGDVTADLASMLKAGDFGALAITPQSQAAQPQPSSPQPTQQGNTAPPDNVGVGPPSDPKLDAAFADFIPLAPDYARSGQFLVTPDGVILAAAPLADGRTLAAARRMIVDPRLTRIASGAETFEHLRRSQRKLRLLGLSTLGLLTLLLVFATTWAAIHLARGIGRPIRSLAEAAQEVARGNLAHRVDVTGDDELAVLAETFNRMTAQLEENRRHIEANAAALGESNLALEERRGYIETVLESLSTGVVSLDAENRLTTINASAVQMLRLPAPPAAGTPFAEIVNPENRVVLERVIARARRSGRAAWQMDLAHAVATSANTNGDGEDNTIRASANSDTAPAHAYGSASSHSHENANGGDGESSATPVALTATALGAPGDEARGVVLVIEDLTELLAAQRAAAWSEVARRMAHEIKNPLTPIQLSAERIARNFPKPVRASGGDGEILDIGGNGHDTDDRVAHIVDECTRTITREVAGLKAMVDEFSQFARLPRARLEPADLNEVVRQSVALYEDRLDDARLDVLLAPTLPHALIDAEQLRRVFINLIDNALEATARNEGERRITVATAHDPARGLLLAEVADIGHGIAREDFARLFQPYFSTRGRGTGLGLAIVRHIINDHGGRIRARSNHPRGAKFLVELPVAEEARGDSNQQSAISNQPDKKTAELENTES